MAQHGDVSKLPVWAQQRIDKLSADVEYWKRIAKAGPDDSDTFVDRMGGLENNKPLGERPRIVFILDDGARLIVRNRGSHVEVTTRDTGLNDSITVQPRLGNSILLKPALRIDED